MGTGAAEERFLPAAPPLPFLAATPAEGALIDSVVVESDRGNAPSSLSSSLALRRCLALVSVAAEELADMRLRLSVDVTGDAAGDGDVLWGDGGGDAI